MPHLIFILFLFALGACVGSFLNVVVWRLPRDESLVSPGSHCPNCNTPLAWYDNIPIFGWIALRGKCRYCKEKISPRYPIVEAITALLFVFYYVMFFIEQVGPCAQPVRRVLYFQRDWPIYFLDMLLIAALLAASLIDAELFIIPIEIPWLVAVVAMVAHALIPADVAGAMEVSWLGAAVAIGGGLGLLASIVLFQLGFITRSFPKGEPLLEVDREQLAREIEQAKRENKPLDFEGELPPPYTRGQIRLEISKEMLFLLPPMIGAIVAVVIASTHLEKFESLVSHQWLLGLLGGILGALVGAFVVWITRILGTIAFGRVAMGLGDVHLMFGVGAVIGAGASTVAFFIAPFFGILIAIWMLLSGKRRELPYGPYLSLASAFVMLFYCPIADYLTPGVIGIISIVRARMGYN